MKRVLFVVVSILIVVLAGCAGSGVDIPTDPHETLIYSSSPQRPDWTLNDPGASDGYMLFVGISDRYSTEKAARDDALRDAKGGIVKYMGTLVQDKWEKASTSFGLEGDVIDPTAATVAYQKQLSVNMATNVRVKSWYIEKWQTPTGIGYQVYALSKVPEATMDASYKKTANVMAKDAERKAKEAGDEIAQKQAEKAADFWEQMRDQGVTE